MDFILGLRIRPKLEGEFLKLGGVFSLMWTIEVWWKVMSHWWHFVLHTLDLGFGDSSLGLKSCSRVMRLLCYVVLLVLDLNVSLP